MKIRAFALLVLLPIFVNAMETCEEQPLLQAPPRNKMEKFNRTVDTVNHLLEGDALNNQAACAVANVARMGYEGCCGITLVLTGGVSALGNPPLGVMGMIAGLACLTSAMKDSMYAMHLAESDTIRQRHLRLLTNAGKTVCCVMSRQPSTDQSHGDGYEEV
jgi:hypothetical protein